MGDRPRYAELHAHSAFSFLDGTAEPRDLVAAAVAMGLSALGLTDHDGLFGAAALAEAAEGTGLGTVFGAELNLDLPSPRAGVPDPGGQHLLLLARSADGYRRLSAAIGAAHLAGGAKGLPVYDLPALAAALRGHVAVLTGCRKGAVPAALAAHGPDAAAGQLADLTDLFGPENVYVELTRHNVPGEDARNDALATIAARLAVPTIATNAVHHPHPRDWPKFTALAALRARRSLPDMDSWLPGGPGAYLRTPAEMSSRMARYPGAVDRAADLGDRCSIDFARLRPALPRFPVPDGHDEASWLRKITQDGAARRYGTRKEHPRAYAQIDHELTIINALGFPGYFLIVHEIVEFCRTEGILCQGRGSAANSAVVFALGISNVDAVKHNLLFERFLNPERGDEPPDIDLDIEAGSPRERVIQHVYARYGRDRAALLANVVTMKPRMALREASRALGYTPGLGDSHAARLGPGEELPTSDPEIPAQVLELAAALEGTPRHLSQHPGGMVIADRPIAEVVPTEWAAMENRTVLQWDKSSAEYARLVKFDLLGLGALGMVHTAFDLIAEHHGVAGLDLHSIPAEDPAVYAMFADADTIGCFQVESRAQRSSIQVTRPKTFYDLVIQLGLIRPGPGASGASRSYLRRLTGQEPAVALHRLLEPVLARTLMVPLWQEQILAMAVAVAGFTPGAADRLRRAMGSKRSTEQMAALREQLMDGMAARGVPPDAAEKIYEQISAFAHYGFPESHAIAFARLAEITGWIKRYYPAAMLSALLAHQPMGFYSPATLISDARRHQVAVRRPDIHASGASAVLEPLTDAERAGYRPRHRYASPHPQPVVRLGLGDLRHVGADTAAAVVAERDRNGEFADVEDLAARTGLSGAALESMATSGALKPLEADRRRALWTAGAAAGTRPDHLPGTAPGTAPPPLEAMTVIEETIADLWATGSAEVHPMSHARERLTAIGAITADQLEDEPSGRRAIRIGAMITHIQRPPAAGGMAFVGAEDETGTFDIHFTPAAYEANKRVILTRAAVLVLGTVRSSGRAVHVMAGRVEPLWLGPAGRSRPRTGR